ncbi:MAG: phosphoribosylamine--glycine ligase, partial [Sphaerochaetaceae bacterium]|nr:phosphoribosylamine--glycine ligase [Sphaerochaetaceae bacterium]
MNVAILGTGGREHALAVKSLRSSHVRQVHVIPGNTGMLMSEGLTIVPQWDDTFPSLERYLSENGISLLIVGNEVYLERGVADYFRETSVKVFGPSKKASQLETSKDYAKQFMARHAIPTANFTTCENYETAAAQMAGTEGTLVIKQDGLALGKGVLVTDDREEADAFLKESFTGSGKVVFEQFLSGREFSLLAFVNQEYYNLMAVARDYKRAYDGDEGLNTGGMGAYTPVEYVSEEDMRYVEEHIVLPTVIGLQDDGIDFTGIIYFGLMKTDDGVKVIEYNTRFGDPEAEVLLEAMTSDLIDALFATFEKRAFTLTWKEGITLGVCLASRDYPSSYQKGYRIDIPQHIGCYS